ncbi:MAG: hypothetical protein WDN45_06470 [Caulobacteraceae bacterium]
MIGKDPPRALLAAGATLGLTTAAQAENWYAFYMVPMGVAYVDKDSIIYRPGHVSAKVQSTFPRAPASGAERPGPHLQQVGGHDRYRLQGPGLPQCGARPLHRCWPATGRR